MRIKNREGLNNAQSLASSDPQKYWLKLAQENFLWKKTPQIALKGNFNAGNITWFEDGELNITENCLDRHLEECPDKIALIFEPNDPEEGKKIFTYHQLHQEVLKVTQGLSDLGVKKGDRVVFYMGQVPELLMGLLATARLGAIHSVVFAGFSSQSLADRINDCQAKFLVVNDFGLRGDKKIPLKSIADQALEKTPSIEKVLVYKRGNEKVNIKEGRDIWWSHQIPEKAPNSFPAVTMKAEDPLFILYTSGSTGKPKGLLHTTAGYMVYAAYSFQNVFQVEPEDIFWCTADIGWITGHTYMAYGPLLSGATQLMFEGVPTWPKVDRFWEVVEKYKVTHFYTAPTAIRALECHGTEPVTSHDLSSLKVLGTVGEPINVEAWNWYNEVVGKGRCPLVDTWWQTETGGIMISALAGISKTIPTFATAPLPGINPVLVDAEGKTLTETKTDGYLCIDKPWPSIARTIYGDHHRYMQTYFSSYPGKYFTGDGCRRDEKNNYRITGRVDDVINVSGHRLGTAEIENAINQHEQVVESAVVGFPHDIKGQGIYAYVIAPTMTSLEKSQTEIIAKVREIIGPLAKPDKVLLVSGLPKTRSGKIMRRILRKVAAGEYNSFGDTSTLLNPEIVEEIAAQAQKEN